MTGFLCSTVLFLMMLGSPCVLSAQSIMELRQAAVNRPRRLIMDNDGNDVVTMKALTTKEFLVQRTSPLAGSNEDTIFYCSNATFGLSTRPSRVWQPRDYRASGKEACRNYDIDGISLDFFRHPVFFKSTFEGKVASREEMASMTDLIRRVLKMTERIGAEKGKPLMVMPFRN